MGTRRQAREVCLQMLFQVDLSPNTPIETVKELIREKISNVKLFNFAVELFCGTMECRAMLDRRIVAVAENWAIDRMSATDRNVLRLGAYELFFTETPPPVVIDESLELAKRFGNKHSSQFVNGILDKLYAEKKETEGNDQETITES